MEEAGRFALGVVAGGTWLVVRYNEIWKITDADIEIGI
jgi:hypothetical protein